MLENAAISVALNLVGPYWQIIEITTGEINNSAIDWRNRVKKIVAIKLVDIGLFWHRRIITTDNVKIIKPITSFNKEELFTNE